ncbi:MAG: glycerol-3-phosphate 1-O-acyltransferase PlsY [Verrucomicrobia bacterium]|nr:glycerol-3-phosphate 1-O-acyltransferase PlsY [Verrucomicrobiota bacterium]
MVLPFLIAAVVGYLLGSLPFGYLVARAKGVNIFEVGSKNPGATNVRRVLGHGPGNLVMALDALKGAVAAGWPILLCYLNRPAGSSYCGSDPYTTYELGLVGLIGAMVGHAFSCFTKFRGGKSVATGAGGFLVLFPYGALIALAAFLLVLAVFRYVSLASIVAALSLPVTAYFLNQPPLLIGLSAAVAAFIVIRHRANVARLLAGTENKVGQKKAESKS